MNKINKIYNKYKLTNDYKIFEFIINLYLLECGYRNIFQIEIYNNNKIIDKLINIINKTKYNYKIYNEKNIRFIVYDKDTFDIDKLDETWGKKFAKQLGKFYICASDKYKENEYNYQIMIYIGRKNIGYSPYVQMCNKTTIIKNINKIVKIFDEIKTILLNLDKNLYTSIQVYKY
jgi:hypothetical protein